MESIFSILYESDKGVCHLGTDFLVYTEGIFITAGHIFRKLRDKNSPLILNKFKALFFDNGEPVLFDFLEVFYESLQVDSPERILENSVQKGPVYIDIAIGKILNPPNFKHLLLDRRRPLKREELLVKGFLNSKQENNFGNVFLHLNQLELITLKPKKLFVSENDALITGFEKFYNCSRHSVPNKHFYNNCITLKPKMDKAFEASGCPVINTKGHVAGILISGSQNQMYILLAKYCSKSIQFKTHYLYNPYEYLL